MEDDSIFEQEAWLDDEYYLIKTDAAAAEQSLKAMGHWNRLLDAKISHAKAEIEKTNRWLKDRTEEINQKIQFHEGVCRGHLDAVGGKSTKLINGTIKSRQVPEKVVFVLSDGVTEDKKRSLFTEWAKVHRPELVETVVTDKVDAVEVRKAIKKDGELFVGTSLTDPSVSHSFEVF